MEKDAVKKTHVGLLEGFRNAVSLHDSFFSHLQSSSKIMLKVGKWEKFADLIRHSSDKRMLLSEDLLSKSGLFNGTECHLKVDGKTLQLGPFVGVFTSIRHIRQLNRQNISLRVSEFLRANEKSMVVLYYFCVRDLLWDKKAIMGTCFNPTNHKFEQRIFPFPDVLYDRASGRAYRKYGQHVLARNKMDMMEIPKVNATHYFDKWDLFQDLNRYNSVKHYLPETKIYKPAHLKTMLRRYPVIYLKATVGSQGSRIMKLEKKDNKYRFSAYKKDLKTGLVSSLKAISQQITAFFGQDKIIMQQGIQLLKVDNGNVDMRATVQRNGLGKLEINSIAVRMGKEGYPITSSRTGSSIIRLEEFMKSYGKHYSEGLVERINRFLNRIYLRIEDIYGPFGEMGIDFGVDDVSGNIYFIESNAKPAKDSLYKSFDRKTIDLAFQNPLEYAKYLSGFVNKRN